MEDYTSMEEHRELVKRLRWGWPEGEITSKDMPRIRKDALEAANAIDWLMRRLEPKP